MAGCWPSSFFFLRVYGPRRSPVMRRSPAHGASHIIKAFTSLIKIQFEQNKTSG